MLSKLTDLYQISLERDFITIFIFKGWLKFFLHKKSISAVRFYIHKPVINLVCRKDKTEKYFSIFGCQERGFAQRGVARRGGCPEKGLSREEVARRRGCPERGLPGEGVVRRGGCPKRGLPREGVARREGCLERGLPGEGLPGEGLPVVASHQFGL